MTNLISTIRPTFAFGALGRPFGLRAEPALSDRPRLTREEIVDLFGDALYETTRN